MSALQRCTVMAKDDEDPSENCTNMCALSNTFVKSEDKCSKLKVNEDINNDYVSVSQLSVTNDRVPYNENNATNEEQCCELYDRVDIENGVEHDLHGNEVLTQVFAAPQVKTHLPIGDYMNLSRVYSISNFIFRGLKKWYKQALKENAAEKCNFPSAKVHYLLAAQ